eukprot:2562424-Rhodomonas_salina.2
MAKVRYLSTKVRYLSTKVRHLSAVWNAPASASEAVRSHYTLSQYRTARISVPDIAHHTLSQYRTSRKSAISVWCGTYQHRLGRP